MKPDFHIISQDRLPIFKTNSASFGNPDFASVLAKDEIMYSQFKNQTQK
jgi:hypothetical protein